jgi:hypothetical protein
MTAADITTVPLTSVEETRLVELEGIVSAGLQTFVTVGTALAEIQTGRLYRATHGTFEHYVRDRFGLGSTHAYDKIRSAATVTALSAMADIPVPVNERQARALSGLPSETAANVMVETVDTVGPKPTAADIARTRDRVVRRPLPESTMPRRRAPLPDAWRAASWEYLRAVERLQRLVNDARFPAFAGTGERSIYGPLERPLAISMDLQNFIADAVEGRIRFDPQRGWITPSKDEEYVVWQYAADHDELASRPVRDKAIYLERGLRTSWFSGNQRLIRPAVERAGTKMQFDRAKNAVGVPAAATDDVVAAIEFAGGTVRSRGDDE